MLLGGVGKDLVKGLGKMWPEYATEKKKKNMKMNNYYLIFLQ